MNHSSARRLFPILLALLLSTLPLTAQNPEEWKFLGPDGGLVTEMVAAPSNPQVVYATAQGTLYRSVDRGVTWTRGTDATFHPAVDAGDPNLVYAVQPPRVVRSLNGGLTWQPLDLPGGPVNQLVAHPRFRRTVFAVTDEGLFQSTNAGLSWRLIERGLPAEYRATLLVIDPTAPRRMYLALSDLAQTPQLFKSGDGGTTWQRIDNGPLRGKPVLAVALRPRSSRVLYASTAEDIYKSADGGRSWTAIGHAGGVHGIMTFLAVQPSRPSVVYAGGGSGLFRSPDAGATWVRTGLPEGFSVTALIAFDRGLLAGVSAPGHSGGVVRSPDGGLSWIGPSRGIRALTVTSIQFGEPGILWVIADNVLYQSVDRGQTWGPVQIHLAPALPQVAVAVDPSDRKNAYVLYSDGTLWLTRNGGFSWEPGGNAGLQALDLEIDPLNPAVLYAAGFGGISKSTDGGSTWTALAVEEALYQEIDIAPSVPTTLYAGAMDETFQPFFLRSPNGGATWTRLPFTPRDLTPPSLAVDSLTATTVHTADDGFILRSTDAGSTWSILSEPIDARSIYPVELAPSGQLYAAVWNEGVFVLMGSELVRLGNRTLPWIFTALAVDPHDPCRIYAGAQGTSLLGFTFSDPADCP